VSSPRLGWGWRANQQVAEQQAKAQHEDPIELLSDSENDLSDEDSSRCESVAQDLQLGTDISNGDAKSDNSLQPSSPISTFQQLSGCSTEQAAGQALMATELPDKHEHSELKHARKAIDKSLPGNGKSASSSFVCCGRYQRFNSSTGV
jgi:hypothetical protein